MSDPVPTTQELILSGIEKGKNNIVPHAATTVTEVKWDDEIFKTKYVPKVLYKARATQTQAVCCGHAFLHLYINGSLPAGVGEDDVFIGLLSAMKSKAGVFMVHKDLFNDNSASDIATFNWNMEYSVDNPEYILAKKAMHKVQIRDTSVSTTLDIAKVSAWLSSVRKLATKEPQEFINICGFLMLQMVRICVKEPEGTIKHIMTCAPFNLKNFYALPDEYWYVPAPSDKTLRWYARMFERFSSLCDKVLTIIIYSYCFADDETYKAIAPIYKASCMVALSETGLGCIGWLNKVAILLRIDIMELVEYFCQSYFNKIVLSVVNFANKYMFKDSGERTWPFARLLEDGAFISISTRECPMFAGILIAIYCGLNEDSDLWSIKQIAGCSSQDIKPFCISYASAILKDIRELKPETAFTKQAKKVAGLVVLEKGKTKERKKRQQTVLPQDDQEQDSGQESESEGLIDL